MANMGDRNDAKLWIHCNRCFEKYIYKKFRFYMLACQHILCERCAPARFDQSPRDVLLYGCPMCKRITRGRELNNSLPKYLKDWFNPEYWNDGIAHTVAYKFQRFHFKSLHEHINRTMRTTDKVILDKQLILAACQETYLQNKRDHEVRKILKAQLHAIKKQRRAQQKAIQSSSQNNDRDPHIQQNLDQIARESQRPIENIITLSQSFDKSLITSFMPFPESTFDL